MTNNFKHYSNREEYIASQWVNNTEWIIETGYNCEIIPDNTAHHDLIIKFIKDEEKILSVKVEVKEEENYWYSKTGNIGLDYLSAFTFKSETNFTRGQWVESHEFEKFINSIEILREGKLFLCDADIQLFYSEDNNNITLLKAYDNKSLKESRKDLEKMFRLRINNKNSYGRGVAEDTWESAAFFVNPQYQILKKHEVNNFEELKKSVNK